MKKISLWVSVALAVVLLGSCATSIPVTLRKPSLIDMGGVKSVVVLPFGFTRDGATGDYLSAALFRFSGAYRYVSPRDQEVAGNLTNALNQAILDTKAYTVISSSQLLLNMASGKGIAGAVDAVVNGEITSLAVDDKNGWEDVKQSDGSIKSTFWASRYVSFEFVYRVIRTSDGAVLGQMKKWGTRDSGKVYGNDAWSRITSTESYCNEIIRGVYSQFQRELAPYSVQEYRVLEKDQAKDARMKQADELVKKGSYNEALAIFSAVYAETKNFAAGYNAAEMTEILGNLKGAIAMMQDLYAATGNPKAQKELARMQATLADIERLAKSDK